MAKKQKPADHGPEPEDESDFDQSLKGSAEGLGGGPGAGLDDEDEDLGVDEPTAEAIAPARAVTAEDPVKEGKLYACHMGKVSLITDDRKQGEQFDYDPGCVVEMRGKPSHVDDLRREDKVKLFGNPVIRIEATR